MKKREGKKGGTCCKLRLFYVPLLENKLYEVFFHYTCI